jgi:hypothetical protein
MIGGHESARIIAGRFGAPISFAGGNFIIHQAMFPFHQWANLINLNPLPNPVRYS